MTNETNQQTYFELNNATSDSNYYTVQDFVSNFKKPNKII